MNNHMRQGQNNNNKRSRGRGGRKPQNSSNRAYDSNGPDVKIRGTATHVCEKYQQLARDAISAGDRVTAENYYQHAEHYYRLLMASQVMADGQPRPQNNLGYRPQEDEEEDFDQSEQIEQQGFQPQHRTQPYHENAGNQGNQRHGGGQQYNNNNNNYRQQNEGQQGSNGGAQPRQSQPQQLDAEPDGEQPVPVEGGFQPSFAPSDQGGGFPAGEGQRRRQGRRRRQRHEGGGAPAAGGEGGEEGFDSAEAAAPGGENSVS
jgi:hypothetical protein